MAFPIQYKSIVLAVFLAFRHFVENLCSSKIVSIQTDEGGKFHPLRPYLVSAGISLRLSCPHSHAQNGTVERKHRHVVEMGLALLAHSAIPFKFWPRAFTTSVYLINRLPSLSLGHISPFHLFFNWAPDYNFLHVFGCEYRPHLWPFNRQKMDFRSARAVFLGCSPDHKGYKCFILLSGKIIISRDVHFSESSFPFKSLTSTLTAQPFSSTHTLFPFPLSAPGPNQPTI